MFRRFPKFSYLRVRQFIDTLSKYFRNLHESGAG